MNDIAHAPSPTPAGKAAETHANDHEEAAAERARLTYIGHALPWPVVVLWAAFLLFGLIYFVVHL